MELNTIFSEGLWGKSADRINRNFERVGSEVDKMKYAAYNSKLYATVELLRQELPSPKVGDWAIVGSSIPGEIYRCDEDGVWSDTGETGGGYGMEVTEMHVEQNVYTGDVTNAADNEDLVSELDEEGKEVLKLADKTYDAATFSGMGRVYLRKNLTGGKNVLAQEMMSEPNTRYIIQYDYDLNGETICIPEGCTLDFQGGSLNNGTCELNRTFIETNKCAFKNCTINGTCYNSTISIDWFGADGSGEEDSTEAIKYAIRLAYNSYSDTLNDYTKRCSTIHIPIGKYIVSSPLIDSGDEYEYGSFNFVGEGQRASIIKYNGKDGTYLFNNDDIFAYTNFQNIGFHGNNISSFMKLYSSTSKGIAQSFTFNGIRIGSFKTVIEASGNALCSEINFINCKIVYFTNEESILFLMNNLQAVNWRFIGTDIEQTNGIIFKLLQGTFISLYSGSIIPFKGTVIEVPVESTPSTFSQHNSPQIQMYGCRFELRDNSRLIVNNTYATTNFLFNGCMMGGLLIKADEDIYQIVIEPVHPNNPGTSNCKIFFRNCTSLTNYKIKSTAGVSAYSSPSEIHFDKCVVSVRDIINRSSIEEPNNAEGTLKIFKDGVLYPISSKCVFRNGHEPANYLLKNKSNYNFALLQPSKEVDFGANLQVGLYVGALTFNLYPSESITIYVANTEGTYVYGRYTLSAYTRFIQTIRVDKLITEDAGIVIKVTNNSSDTVCQIIGVIEVCQTFPSSYHILQDAERISNLHTNNKGMAFYDSVTNRLGFFDGTWMRDANGFYIGYKNRGTTEDRPSINANSSKGFMYFDTTLNKPIWWAGTKWVDSTGATV